MTKAGFVGRVFDRSRLKTHITRFPALVNDRTAWNKLFRRSFWDEHGFRFPEGVYYEDIPVTLPAHYLARSVDLIDEPVYFWRVREGSDLSITQRRTEPKALRDRVSAVDSVSRFLAEHKFFVSKAVYDRSAIGQDLRFFLDVLPSADPEYRRLFLDLVNGFIDGAHEWCLEQPLAIDRVKWQLVRQRALPELLEVLRFEDEELPVRPAVRGRGGRWYGDYPYRTDERLHIPASAYRLEDELLPVSQIDDISWEGDSLRIEGYAYINMIGAPMEDSQTVDVFARQAGWRRKRIRLETTPVHRPDVTTASAQEFASLDWSGFVATLDTARLKRSGRWRDGTWEIGIRIRAGGVTRTTWLVPLSGAGSGSRVRAHVRGRDASPGGAGLRRDPRHPGAPRARRGALAHPRRSRVATRGRRGSGRAEGTDPPPESARRRLDARLPRPCRPGPTAGGISRQGTGHRPLGRGGSRGRGRPRRGATERCRLGRVLLERRGPEASAPGGGGAGVDLGPERPRDRRP